MVTAISLLLLGATTWIYVGAMRVYRRTQALENIYATARLFNRDLRDFFGKVVPVPGSWLTPACLQFPGTPNATSNDIDGYYLNSNSSPSKSAAMQHNTVWDNFFSRAQFPSPLTDDCQGLQRGPWGGTDALQWAQTPDVISGLQGWWMPGFYGQRDGSNPAVLAANDIMAGSWGWPRPDYRLDMDFDDPADHHTAACWFYAEDRRFNSARTLALDNANVVLVSLKASRRMVNGRETTSLAFLRHQIVGFDSTHGNLLREEQTLGNLLRSIRITPYCLASDERLVPMDDAALGCGLTGAPLPSGGTARPRCFDIEYTLRDEDTHAAHSFSLRVYCPMTE